VDRHRRVRRQGVAAHPFGGIFRITFAGEGCYVADVTFYRWEDMEKEKLSDLLDRRLITGDRMMLAHVYLKKGCVVPRHQHENEQLTYILNGALRFWIGEDESKEVIVRAGEVLHIPSWVWHKAEAIEDTLDVDVFSPPRQDWINKTDDYLRR
jgi:quercetin dioxygenase-like cupin family protein